jgi:hypothetical protein
MDVGSFSSGQDALSKSPAPAHGLAGHDARQAPSGAFLFGYFLFTPGILPYALRASFAVRTRFLRVRGHAKRK